MKELTTYEMDMVSGSYGNGFFNDVGEAVTSSILGGITLGLTGAIIGGKNGGNGGGVLGIGSIGQLVGMIGGGMIGAVGGAIGAPMVGFDNTWKYAQEFMKGVIGGGI